MNFPKQIMRKMELIKMGVPKELLNRIYDEPGQRIAWKLDPTLRNSPILYDTEKLQDRIYEDMRLDRALNNRRL